MSIDAKINKIGIASLSKMQQDTIDAIKTGKNDVLVVSPTGTGKTLAYLLPLVERLESLVANDNNDSSIASVVVVVPGRELALQSQEVLRSFTSQIKGLSLYGGRPTMDEHREFNKVKPHILFGTPGRLNDHIDKQNIPIENITTLVIDEFDKCLEMGFADEMSKLIASLPNIKQRVLLSATMSEAIPRFVNMRRTKTIDYSPKESNDVERIKIYKVLSENKDKLGTLSNLLLEFGEESSVVFLNYRESVERTAHFLMEQGFGVSLFHGGLEQREREAALYRFANGSANILVTTDLASRGLDIPDIQNIIHYHLPETKENYIHRIGRTARWDKEGRAFFLLNAEETIPDYVEEDVTIHEVNISNRTPAKPKMTTLYIGKGKKDKLSKADIVGFLCKKGGLKGNEIGKISVMERYTYVAIDRRKLKEVLNNVRGEKIKGVKTIVETVK